VWLAKEVSVDSIAEELEESLNRLEWGCRFSHDWVEAFHKDRAIAAYESFLDESLAEPVR
jgi:hypothetical protein